MFTELMPVRIKYIIENVYDNSFSLQFLVTTIHIIVHGIYSL